MDPHSFCNELQVWRVLPWQYDGWFPWKTKGWIKPLLLAPLGPPSLPGLPIRSPPSLLHFSFQWKSVWSQGSLWLLVGLHFNAFAVLAPFLLPSSECILGLRNAMSLRLQVCDLLTVILTSSAHPPPPPPLSTWQPMPSCRMS